MAGQGFCRECRGIVALDDAGCCVNGHGADAIYQPDAAPSPPPPFAQQPFGGPPPPPRPYAYGVPVKQPGDGKAVAAFVLGLLGLIAWCLPILGLPVSVTGLVLGTQGLKSGKRSLAVAGIVLCAIALLATLVNGAAGAYFGFRSALGS